MNYRGLYGCYYAYKMRVNPTIQLLPSGNAELPLLRAILPSRGGMLVVVQRDDKR
jgi:hypothetical protein